ncbi:hypothetical protein JW962_00180 [Candidatus Dojkabacteria bacterium]|nr:hypothetical protein [Candidatus Dojkabacteria bacterium]
MDSKVIVLKLGGSVISPASDRAINHRFIRELKKEILLPMINIGYKFAITVGGGYLARQYGNELLDLGADDIHRHRVGIVATLMNATVVQAFLSDICSEHIVALDDYLQLFKFVNKKYSFEEKPIFLACGGHRHESSTDMNAVMLAMRLSASRIVSIKNVDGVYNKNPTKYKDAERISHLTWDSYSKIIDGVTQHKPGASWPIDPIAAKTAHENGLSFIVLGPDIRNLKNMFMQESFVGTVVD